jgi:HD superfamily phosphohydrolase
MELAGKMASYAIEMSDEKEGHHFLELCQKCLGGKDLEQTKKLVLQLVRLSGLLHDLGHLPLSHLSETAIGEDGVDLYSEDPDFNRFAEKAAGKAPPIHEFATFCLIRDNKELDQLLKGSYDYKASLLNIFGPQPLGVFATIHDIVSSDVDADRADFIIRDGITSGIGFGQYDITRLVESMVLCWDDTGKYYQVMPSISALSTVEAFFLERYKLYKWLYYHPHVVLTDTATEQIIARLIGHSKTPGHPLGDLLKIEDFHYSRYIVDELPFNDDDLMSKLKRAFVICQQDIQEFRGDFAILCPLLRIVLFREKYAKAVFKNISEYRAFDKEIKDCIRTDGVYGDQLPRTPLLNDYVERANEHLVIRDEHRLREVLLGDGQFALESDRGRFRGYSAISYEEIANIAGEMSHLVRKEFKTLACLVDKNNRAVPLSDLSESVRQLRAAWRNDMQLFLFIVRTSKPTPSEWEAIIAENRVRVRNHMKQLWAQDLLRSKEKQK